MKNATKVLVMVCLLFGVCITLYSDEERIAQNLKEYDGIVYDSELYRFEYNTEAFKLNFSVTKALFIITVSIVATGIVFSIIQFIFSFYYNLSRRFSEDEIEIKFLWFSFKIKTAYLGIILLIISLAFLYLYMKIAAPMAYPQGDIALLEKDIESRFFGNEYVDSLDQQLFDFDKFNFALTKKIYQWDLFTKKFLFTMTFAIISMGIVLSIVYFVVSALIGKAIKTPRKEAIEISVGEIAKIKGRTRAVGVILLIISFGFLCLTMTTIYHVQYLSPGYKVIPYHL